MSFSLTPEQKQSGLWLACGFALLALVVALGPVLTPFIAAAILAYALNPAVDWLASHRIGRFGLPRGIGVTLVILSFLAAIAALGLIVVPVLQKEMFLLQAKIPVFLAKIDEALGPALHILGVKTRFDIPGIERILAQYLSAGGNEMWSAVLASAKVGGIAVLGWIATAVLIPVALFYLLLDWHTVIRRIADAVPRRWLSHATVLASEVDTLLAQYLRGQLLVMLVLAAYYSGALTLAGFDVALPVGLITGLLVFIPYLGFGFGLTLALIAAILQFDGLQGLAAVAFIYGVGQVLEGFFLTPRFVGERIGLSPLAVIFALLAFGQLFGFIGILLALPATAVVSVGWKHLRLYYLNSSFYKRSN